MTSLKRDWTLLVALLTLSAAIAHAEVRTWTKVNGERIDAELAGQTKVAVKLRTANGSIEIWSKDRLSEEDRIFIGLPAAGETSTATGTAPTQAAAPTPTPAAKSPDAPAVAKSSNATGPAVNAPLTQKIAPHLVELKGNKFVALPADRTANVKFYAFYFSAGWCPPCHRFTPDLVKTYSKLREKHPEFEIVLVSSDESEGAMRDYMREFGISFPAIRYSDISKTPAVTAYAESGIPNLVFVDGDGKVLSASFVKGDYVGPQKILKEIVKKLN